MIGNCSRSKKLNTVICYLLLTVILHLVPESVGQQANSESKCVPITSEKCNDLPYNFTRYVFFFFNFFAYVCLFLLFSQLLLLLPFAVIFIVLQNLCLISIDIFSGLEFVADIGSHTHTHKKKRKKKNNEKSKKKKKKKKI